MASCGNINKGSKRRKKSPESDLMHAIHDTLVRAGVTLWRNNCGIATWDNGARTRYGLGVGSADLVGIWRGRFVAIEVKATTGQTEAQKCWQRAVDQAGGLYIVARSVEEAIDGIFL